MRYFCCTSSGRPYTLGGQVFNFEPTSLRGGSWYGVLAVDDSAANILESSGVPMIGEISQAEYEDEKKKVTEHEQRSVASAVPLTGNPLIHPPVKLAGHPTSPTSVEAKAPAEEPKVQGTLEMTDKAPPTDPILEQRSEKFRIPSKE